jgi:hypothetical protein
MDSIRLDFTPKGLFPNRGDEANKDSKCVVVAEVVNCLSRRWDLNTVTQKSVIDLAQKRYATISGNIKPLDDVESMAFSLYEKGVPPELVKRYYSYLLTPEDAMQWTINLC